MRTLLPRVILFLLLAVLAVRPVAGQDYGGTWSFVRAVDGDTADIKRGRRTIRIRLANIDAPEIRQPGGIEARDELKAFLDGERITINGPKREKYGRVLCDLTPWMEQSTTHHMVETGWAWVYVALNKDKTLPPLEATAKKAKRGLWAAPVTPIPPWRWRAGVRQWPEPQPMPRAGQRAGRSVLVLLGVGPLPRPGGGVEVTAAGFLVP